jgi:hypothetical protein
MIKGVAIYTAGVGSGIFVSAYVIRQLLPMVAQGVGEAAGRALDQEAFDRLMQEFNFSLIQFGYDSDLDPNSFSGRLSKKTGRFFTAGIQPKKESV